MKLQALFTIKDNQLQKKDGSIFPLEKAECLNSALCSSSTDLQGKEDALFFIKTPWSAIGKDESSYNEEFLANLRDFLKKLEEISAFAFIIPLADSPVTNQQEKEDFTASCKHCARRIKDCANLIGFSIPEEADPAYFIEELRQKHLHYIFIQSEKGKITLK